MSPPTETDAISLDVRPEPDAGARGWRVELRLSDGLGVPISELVCEIGCLSAATSSFPRETLVELVSELLDAHVSALPSVEREPRSRAGREHGFDRRLRLVPDTGRRSEPVSVHRSLGTGGGRGRVLRLEVLGRDRARVQLDGGDLVLSQRHSEILVLLAAHSAGMSGEQLALALYGEQGKPQTTRAEISRLRRLIGGCIQTDPYRLQAVVQSDIAEVEQLLRHGDAEVAAALYRGALLPRSDAPGVIELRNELDGWTRRAALTSSTDALWAWLNTPSGHDDIQAWKRLLSNIPHCDPRRPLAATRLGRLRPEIGLPELATLET
jgi:hypothetical protein